MTDDPVRRAVERAEHTVAEQRRDHPHGIIPDHQLEMLLKAIDQARMHALVDAMLIADQYLAKHTNIGEAAMMQLRTGLRAELGELL